ncbi:CHAT domain-containing protein [Geodermatophilus sp. URMC 63]
MESRRLAAAALAVAEPDPRGAFGDDELANLRARIHNLLARLLRPGSATQLAAGLTLRPTVGKRIEQELADLLAQAPALAAELEHALWRFNLLEQEILRDPVRAVAERRRRNRSMQDERTRVELQKDEERPEDPLEEQGDAGQRLEWDRGERPQRLEAEQLEELLSGGYPTDVVEDRPLEDVYDGDSLSDTSEILRPVEPSMSDSDAGDIVGDRPSEDVYEEDSLSNLISEILRPVEPSMSDSDAGDAVGDRPSEDVYESEVLENLQPTEVNSEEVPDREEYGEAPDLLNLVRRQQEAQNRETDPPREELRYWNDPMWGLWSKLRRQQEEASPSRPSEPETQPYSPLPTPSFPSASDVPGHVDEPAPPNNSLVQPRRIVSSGVAAVKGDHRPLDSRTVLGAGRKYLYWFAVGPEPRPGRVDVGRAQLLPAFGASAGTRLVVILFPFAGGLVLDPDADEGELVFQQDGPLVVSHSPSLIGRSGDERLLFPIRTPKEPGTYSLRSSVYLGARLLQSRVLQVQVGRRQQLAPHQVITSTTDYSVSESLRDSTLARMDPPRVSILVNDGPNGSHEFRFRGDGDVHATASLDGDMLGRLLLNARTALGRAVWGTEQPWCEGNSDRYAAPRLQQEVMADLVAMARTGYRIWFALQDALARTVAGQLPAREERTLAERLTALLQPSGALELACRQSLRLAVPSALVYDYPLDSGSDDLRFCPEATRAVFDGGGDLTVEPCFDGDCPHYDDLNIVCPGGFWGYRHEIGVPVSLNDGSAGGAVDITPTIPGATAPVFVVGTTTDPSFTGRLRHLGRLHQVHVPITWQIGEERDVVLQLLRKTTPHVVYFLCHGVEKDGLPGLVVGDPTRSSAITPDNLAAYKIAWPDTRPLVVLNGCRTTALDPTKPINFVEAFLRHTHASGVLGTEVTIFEPLATAFAEEVLQRFVHDDVTLGRAVREARLALLRRRNPLGLAYVPYAPTELQMT